MPLWHKASLFLDFVYPRSCVVCGTSVKERGRHLCWDCSRDVSLIQFPFCSWCGDPVQGQVDATYVCAWCRRRPPAFDRARSAAHYEGALQHCVKAFKYGKATHLVRELGGMLSSCVDVHFANEVIDAVTYVPLHSRRRRERTFNQSCLLAQHVAGRAGFEFSDAGLYRTRHTDTQALLNAAARRKNVEGAFAVRPNGWVSGRSLLLIDDIMTTGATVSAVAKALKQAGAHRVWVATVGRGV
ncbi:MAG: ComF family protein [Kiritimatiellia bacterium]|jgi:ComF family protein|nr:ComF family protein [Kiritimatiellia bacterium]MDP6630052.1 ComF family protein [Kiritimatiellia bacterium]MDP6811393.1 ComF family protein [Kiritimatiellia bacterium]MDP7023811.1 ComF family protein [Kiritimatiellia bacterium]